MVVILQAIMVVIFIIALPLTVASALLKLYGKKFGSLKAFFSLTALSMVTILILQLIKLYQ